MFIIQGKSGEPAGSIKVIKSSRTEALGTAHEFLDQGIQFVTIVGDERTYSVEEFSLTIKTD